MSDRNLHPADAMREALEAAQRILIYHGATDDALTVARALLSAHPSTEKGKPT